LSEALQKLLREAIAKNRDLNAVPIGGPTLRGASVIERLFANPSFERGVAGSLLGVAAGDLINHFVLHPEDKATPAGHHARYAIIDTHNNTTIKFIGAHRLYRLLVRPRGRSRTRKIVVVSAPTGQQIVPVR